MDHTMHVISHTHWDREWYLTFQQFRMRLVDLVDHLLDILDTDPEFRYFNFDGQTIVLEDYLRIRPQNEDKLRKYIEAGRILVGPWYQLNDEFLVSGESTIRSLLVGHRIARDFGGVMKVGYLPDQFGNISQMPQIFREFGIDNCIFGRGYQLVDDRKMEFTWQSPDGSQVLSSLMAFWYNNAQRFPADTEKAVEYTRRIRDTMSPVSSVKDLLLMNGVDHLEAQSDLSGILRRVNEQLRGDRLVHSTLPRYVTAIRKYIDDNHIELPVVEGELREDRGCSVLAGTLSSRIYLKQANEESETWIEKYAEPSSAFAWMVGKEYPGDFLTYAWKLLMENHPHDSICGCSIDQVHEEMMPRFAQVRQVCKELTDRSLAHIASKVNTSSHQPSEFLVVFNPLNWRRTDRVTAIVEIPLGEPVRDVPTVDKSRDVAAIELVDASGRKIPYKLLDRSVHSKQVLNPIELPLAVMVRRFVIEFVAEDVPACGYKTYGINFVGRMPEFEDSLTAPVHWENAISNGLLMAGVYPGGITLTDQQAVAGEPECGQIYSGLCTFEDGGDVGDEYRYRRPVRDRKVTTLAEGPQVCVVDHSPVSATLRISTTMRLPASATPDFQGRCEDSVDCPVTSYVTVTAGSPRVDVVTEVDNRAKNHRLRVLFPSGIQTDTCHAEGHFDVLDRPVRPPKDWWDASTFYPQRSWVDVNDGDRGLAIINNGLPEFEVYDDDARTIALTLLRCVGHLSGGGDTPTAIPTPGAQCLGKHRFEYAILPHKGTWADARVWQQAHQHNTPMLCVQTGSHDGELPAEYSFVEVSSPDLVVSAIKKAEDGDSLIVRFFNILDDDIHDVTVKVSRAVGARVVNANEEPGAELVMQQDGSVTIDVPARKIATIEFVTGE